MSLHNENFKENYVLLQPFCPACGIKTQPNSIYCSNCGFKIEESPQVQSTSKKINSTQNYSTDTPKSTKYVRYAELGDRFVALLLDVVIFSVIASLIGVYIGWGWLLRGTLINFVVGFIYFWLFEAFHDGQTLGKMAMKIQTVDETTLETITPGQAALHVFGKVLFLPIDFILGIFTKGHSSSEDHKYRITQNISKTAVIKL